MRRTLTLLVLAAVAAVAAALLTATPPSGAGATGLPITGVIYDYRTDAPVAGVEVRLREAGGSSPGILMGTATTDATGAFSVTPSMTGFPYWVEVVADSRVQGGYVDNNSPNWVQWDHEAAQPHTEGTALGRIYALPSYVRGTVVNAANGNPVRNLRVSLRDAGNLSTVIGYDDTDVNGFFRIDGIEREDFGLRLIGRDRGYETGWLACNGTVVRTWGAACATGPGGQGRIRIDRL